MQLFNLIVPLALSTLAAGWTLDLYGTDGRHINLHGTRNTDCIDISFTPALNTNRARFNPATTLFPDPTTFDLYVNRRCSGLSYRNGPGNHVLTPARVIRSYRVYGAIIGKLRRMAEIQDKGLDTIEDAESKRDAGADPELED